MGFVELILIGIGLSMDAVCVSISNGMCMKGSKLKHALADAGAFGIFQGLMPTIGFFAGSLFIGIFSKYSDYLVFAIFAVLGGKMIWDALHEEEEEVCKRMTFQLLLVQAVATSIDALAVGVSFSAMNMNIFYSASIIAVTTFVLAFAAFFLGKKVGTMLNKKAGIFGGLLLLGIAVKVLVEHFL